ncbi:MAG: Na+/H+ antiporter subunit E [Chloroflexota bacterium]|jgi:multicomponent Na+:H+ antiporter subunit E
MYYVRTGVLLTVIYLMITSNLSIANIVVGIVVALLVAALVRPPLRTMSPSHYPTSIVATFKYIGTLIWDLILSGVQLAQILLSRQMPINPGIINIPSNCVSELGAALSAHAITLTPGEMTVEMDENYNMYTHVLDAVRAPEYMREAQEMRLKLLDQIFN